MICGTGRHGLVSWFAKQGFTRGAEIGVWKGAFSEWMANHVPGLKLTCVDPWRVYGDYEEVKNDQKLLDEAYEMALKRLEPLGCDIKRQSSVEAATTVDDGSLDFVYIDANHRKDYVLADLNAWVPKVRAGGIVSGHDYRTDKRKPFIEVQQAIDEYTEQHGIDPWFVLTADKSPSYFWVKA